jgi:phosphate transport system permease protein
MAVPWGIAAATCLAGAGTSRWAAVVRFVTELLGGVPSSVVGIFANAVLVAPRYAWLTGRTDAEPLGFSAWAGAFALACVMVPIVVRAAEEAMKQVPEEWRQGSHALGGGLYHTTWRIIYPAALPAMLSGCLLAMGRIAGETAPLLLTAGGSSYWPASPAEPTPFLPKSILSGAVSPFPDMQQLAWGGAFVLLAAIVVLNVVIRLITAAKTAR